MFGRPSGGRIPALGSVVSTHCPRLQWVEPESRPRGSPWVSPLCVRPDTLALGLGCRQCAFYSPRPNAPTALRSEALLRGLIGCPNRFQRGRLPVRLAEWVRGDEYLRQNKNYIKVLRGLGCFFKSTPSVLPYSHKQQFTTNFFSTPLYKPTKI